jgi:hypothetical protein
MPQSHLQLKLGQHFSKVSGELFAMIINATDNHAFQKLSWLLLGSYPMAEAGVHCMYSVPCVHNHNHCYACNEMLHALKIYRVLALCHLHIA